MSPFACRDIKYIRSCVFGFDVCPEPCGVHDLVPSTCIVGLCRCSELLDFVSRVTGEELDEFRR